MVSIPLPPPARTTNPQWSVLPIGTRLVRIYDRTHLGPTSYNHNGPRARFDHHAPGAPRDQPDRGVYYAANTLAGCIVEVFGDIGIIDTGNYGVAEVELLDERTLLDLTCGRAWNAGTVAAITKDTARAATQPWARYFYSTYPRVQGLKYENAHNADIAYVFFERAGDLKLVTDRALADKALQDELFEIADTLELRFYGV